MFWNNPFAKADRGGNGAPPNNTGGGGTGSGVTPNAQNNMPGVAQNGNAGNGSNNGSGMVPNADGNNGDNKNGGTGDDPLLDFGSLWEPNKDKDGNPIQNQNTGDDGYLPKVDPKQFGALLEKMDFTRGVSQEEWAAIQQGGDGAVKGLQSILNKANRQAFSSMFNAMTKMVEGGFKTAQDKFMSGVPDTVRDFMTDDALISGEGTNEIMKNPAFAPLVKHVKNQYLDKFPKASPSEVNRAVKQYFDHMAQSLTKKQQANDNKGTTNADKLRTGADDADFAAWLEAEVGGQSQNSGATN